MTEPGRRLVLLRHGQTEWNQQGRFQGQADIEPDETGRAQAAGVAGLLARLKPTALVSSDLVRAQATAAPLAELTGLELRTDPRLREVFAGSWQGLTGAEIRAQFGEDRARWRAGEDVRPGGNGELRSEVGARVAAALTEYAGQLPAGGLLIAVTHGGALSSGIPTLLGVPRQHWPLVSGVPNCHWSTLISFQQRWILGEHGVYNLPQSILGDES